jgi:hypothetical protein
VANKDPKLITVRRSTVVRAGIIVLVLAALGAGTAVGLTVGSRNSPSATSSAKGASTTTLPGSKTNSSTTTTTTASSLPTVLSCAPGSTPHVRPKTITVGCGTNGITMTGISWSAWEVTTGGQGTGTVHEGLQSAAAIVVVFHDVAGVFQVVSITPSQSASPVAPTATSTPLVTVPTTTSTTADDGIKAVVAVQPGSGWGGN